MFSISARVMAEPQGFSGELRIISRVLLVIEPAKASKSGWYPLSSINCIGTGVQPVNRTIDS